jgi:hypothetical protein
MNLDLIKIIFTGKQAILEEWFLSMRFYHTFLDICAAMELISSQELRKFLNAKKTFYILR